MKNIAPRISLPILITASFFIPHAVALADTVACETDCTTQYGSTDGKTYCDVGCNYGGTCSTGTASYGTDATGVAAAAAFTYGCDDSNSVESVDIAAAAATAADASAAANADAAAASAPAANTTAQSTVTLFNPLGNITDPRALIGLIIKGIISIIGSVTFLMFVYGGVLWITAMGDPKKVQKGKDILLWGVMGLVLIAGSYALVNAIISGLTTGVAST